MINIIQMLLAGQSTAAYALLARIIASLAFQILVVVIQNSHRGKRAVAWEILLVLSLFKAGIDAIRVARGEDRIVGTPMDALTEMLICKLGEMAFESIPGSLLQMFILLSGNYTTAAVLSILISCLSTAFTAAMIAYDQDTNAAKRNSDSKFYGYATHLGGTWLLAHNPCRQVRARYIGEACIDLLLSLSLPRRPRAQQDLRHGFTRPSELALACFVHHRGSCEFPALQAGARRFCLLDSQLRRSHLVISAIWREDCD
jgi:hypothetical protein